MVDITFNSIVVTDVYSFQIQIKVDVVPHVMFMFHMMPETLYARQNKNHKKVCIATLDLRSNS